MVNKEKVKIHSFNDIFGEDNKELEGAQEISISMLQPFHNHPFKLYEGERFDDMVRSIKELGVIVPIIVRPKEGGCFEILSGHNRVNAAKEVGLETVPAVIKEQLSDDEAALIVTETNLMQRSFSDLLHSERAIALAAHHKTLKRQGARTDLLEELEKLLKPHEIGDEGTLCHGGTRLTSLDKVGQKYSLSKRTVARYLRLNELISEILERVDSEEITFLAAVTLSYLKENEQMLLEDILAYEKVKVDKEKADILRSFSETGKLDKEKMQQILSGDITKKKSQAKQPYIKLKSKLLEKYFSREQQQSEIEEIIDKALALYFEHSQVEE